MFRRKDTVLYAKVSGAHLMLTVKWDPSYAGWCVEPAGTLDSLVNNHGFVEDKHLPKQDSVIRVSVVPSRDASGNCVYGMECFVVNSGARTFRRVPKTDCEAVLREKKVNLHEIRLDKKKRY